MIRFSDFRDNYCKRQGAMLVFDKDEGAIKACAYKDGEPAQSWADWQPCNKDNCPALKEGAK